MQPHTIILPLPNHAAFAIYSICLGFGLLVLYHQKLDFSDLLQTETDLNLQQKRFEFLFFYSKFDIFNPINVQFFFPKTVWKIASFQKTVKKAE